MRPLKLTFLLTICTLLSLTVRGQEQYRIAGLVLDNRNNPIKGITVRIYRGSQPIKEVITGQDGAYSLTFYQGDTITTIEYYGSEWNPTTITNVSGAKNHTINKVLNRLGAVASYEQGAELLSSLDQLYFIARKNNVPFSEFTRRYGAAIAAARQTSMPTILRPELERREYLYAQNRYNKYQIQDFNFYPYPSSEFAEVFPSSTSSIDFAQRSSTIELGFQRGVQEIVIDVDRPFDEDVYTIALYTDGSEQPIITQVIRQSQGTKVVRLRFRRNLFKPSNKRYQLVFTASATFKVPITITVEE